MKYALNEWLYEALLNVDIDKLQGLEKRLMETDIRLEYVLDRKTKRIIAELSEEQIEVLAVAYPGIVQQIPMGLALSAGNIRLLEINQDEYFKGNWKKQTENMLFVRYDQRVNIDELLTVDGMLTRLADTLQWIQQKTGDLPQIDGINELCSKAEGRIYKNGIIDKGKKQRLFDDLKRIRALIGDNNLYVNGMLAAFDKEFPDIIYDNYEKIILDLSDIQVCECSLRDLHKWCVYKLLENCNVDKLEITPKEQLVNKEFLSRLLQAVEYEEEVQKKVCELYQRYFSIKKLYEALNPDMIYTGAYSIIIREYYNESEESDTLICSEDNKAHKNEIENHDGEKKDEKI